MENPNKDIQVSDFSAEPYSSVDGKKLLRVSKLDWLQKTDLDGALGWLMTNNFHVGYNDMLNLIKNFVDTNKGSNGNFKLTEGSLEKILGMSEGERGIDAFLGFIRELSIWLSSDNFSMICDKCIKNCLESKVTDEAKLNNTVRLINVFYDRFEDFTLDQGILESIFKYFKDDEEPINGFMLHSLYHEPSDKLYDTSSDFLSGIHKK